MKKQIEVNLQYEATHNWPNADTIPEVAYLKHEHRHIFHIQVRKMVEGVDREIEIIQFKNQILSYLDQYDHKFENFSCEQIAQAIAIRFDASRVKVLEDGENGALVYYHYQ